MAKGNRLNRKKIRPYKELFLTPGINYHTQEEGWKEQHRMLYHEMYTLRDQLQIFKKPEMIPAWIFRMQLFVKRNLPNYVKRLRSHEEVKELLNQKTTQEISR